MATNRPEYRDARTPRAVTVYTIAQESRHVVFKNIPALSGEETIIQDLLNRCSLYGTVENWRQLDKKQQQQQPSQDSFTLPPILVTFATIDQARWVKRKMDDQVFYANLLQVYYAPEYDTVEDMRIKLEDRRTKIHAKLQQASWDDIEDSGGGGNKKKQRRKRFNNKPQQQDGQQQQQLGWSEALLKEQGQRSAEIQGMKEEAFIQLESIHGTTATQTTMETPIDGTLPHALDQPANDLLTSSSFIPKTASSSSSTTATKRRRI